MTYSIGIDSGSTATKGILLADGVIMRRFLCPTPFRPAAAIIEAWDTLRAGLASTPFLTLTGYGRQLVDFADKQVTEISCHGLGARFLAPKTRAVIDIGGQDSKVIQLDDEGNLSDFLMNDKCAAGTGRFLKSFPGHWAPASSNSTASPKTYNRTRSVACVRYLLNLKLSVYVRLAWPPKTFSQA